MKFIFKTLDPLYSATAGTSCVPYHIHTYWLITWFMACRCCCSLQLHVVIMKLKCLWVIRDHLIYSNTRLLFCFVTVVKADFVVWWLSSESIVAGNCKKNRLKDSCFHLSCQARVSENLKQITIDRFSALSVR
jgi:hypothetical protein